VKNTFIDVALPPSPRTQAEASSPARRRAKSLPKDMGSPKKMRSGVGVHSPIYEVEADEEDVYDRHGVDPFRFSIFAMKGTIATTPSTTPTWPCSSTCDSGCESAETT
jgi:hypothetical protein